jgi:small nuclear ribonucleoprotein D3
MSFSGSLTLPMAFFHEGEGLTLTVETKSGDLYRGRASNTEDNFNLYLDKTTITSKDGRMRTLDRVFLRGSTIVLVIFPEILARSPIFDRMRELAKGRVTAKGLGVGRLNAIQAKSACGVGVTSKWAPWAWWQLFLTPSPPPKHTTHTHLFHPSTTLLLQPKRCKGTLPTTHPLVAHHTLGCT